MESDKTCESKGGCGNGGAKSYVPVKTEGNAVRFAGGSSPLSDLSRNFPLVRNFGGLTVSFSERPWLGHRFMTLCAPVTEVLRCFE